MTRLLNSEALKLRTVRATWLMLGIGLFAEALFAGLFTALISLGEITEFDAIQTGTGLLMTLLLVLGVLAITTEFRHGTTGSTFLATPRRFPVLVAKLLTVLGLGLLAGVLYVLVNAGLAIPLYESRGLDLPATGDIVSIYAGVVASFALLAAFGLGIGAIIRNQVGAIIAALASLFIISALPELLPGNIGHFFPAQAIGALHGMPEGGDSSLTQLGGGLVLAAWSLGLWLIGTALIQRRDLND